MAWTLAVNLSRDRPRHHITYTTICSQQLLGYDLTIPDNTKNLRRTTQLPACCCYRLASLSSTRLHFEKHGVNGSVVRPCPITDLWQDFMSHPTYPLHHCIRFLRLSLFPNYPVAPKSSTARTFSAYPCSSKFFSDCILCSFLFSLFAAS